MLCVQLHSLGLAMGRKLPARSQLCMRKMLAHGVCICVLLHARERASTRTAGVCSGVWVLMRLRGGGAVGASSSESRSEVSEGTSRRGKTGLGLGKAGLERRLLIQESLPATDRAQEAVQNLGSQAPLGVGALESVNEVVAGGVGIEDQARAMEEQSNARLRARSLRAGKGKGRRKQGRSANLPMRASKRGGGRRSNVYKESAPREPTRTLRQRTVAVNYEEESESIAGKAWSPDPADMSDGQESAGERQRADLHSNRVVSARPAPVVQGQARRGRRKSGADKAANPLGQELSESAGNEEALRLRELEGAHEERRKRRLEDAAEAEGAGPSGELDRDDADAEYRAARRKLIRDHWGESPEPPPLPRREYTLEEDLAVFRDAERQLRAACEEGDVAEAERLLSRGAVMEEWDNCTEDTVLTLMRAMRRDAKTRSGGAALRVDSSEGSEDDGVLEDILRDLNLTESLSPAFNDADRHSVARGAVQGDGHAGFLSHTAGGAGHREGQLVGSRVRDEGAGDMSDADDAQDDIRAAWREGGRWGNGTWGPLPLEEEKEVSLEGEAFLDCQVTGALRGEFIGNERGYRKYQRSCQEFFAAEFPEHRAFRLTEDADKVGAFTPGEEDCEGLSDSDERLWRDVPELHGWIDPMGRRMQKIEMAVVRNATHTLSAEEQDAIILTQPPCVALQDYMSESLDSHDANDLLVIPKKMTEISRLEIDPFDKLQSKLSTTLGRKEFDFVDALGGFERSSALIGVRGTDQTYNQRRARFMNSKKGSYK